MDTPESKSTPANTRKIKLINPSPSDSSAFQDSPVFNYLSNLSPIQPVKGGPVAQGFPGLASPPLVFTSPRFNSLTNLFNRKLQSSGPNSECSQDHDHDNCHKNERGLGGSIKIEPEFHNRLAYGDQKTCNTEKLVPDAHCSPSGCLDEFLTDPGNCANSSQKLQSDNAQPSLEGGCLEKIDVGNGKALGLNGSALQKGKRISQAKSRISVRLVKNEPRHVISSSECSGASSSLLTDHTSEKCQTGDSFNEASHFERGTLRRCLFDESQRINSVDGPGFWNPIASAQIQESVNMSTGKLGSEQLNNFSKPAVDACVSSVTDSHAVAVSKPLGIGLHLNSVVYPRSTDSAITNQQSSVMRVERKKLLFLTNNQSDGKVDASNVTGKVLISSEEIDRHQACSVPSSNNTIASEAIEQSNNAIETKLHAASTIINEKITLSSDLVENFESSLGSPNTKRKKTSSSTDDDTTKRCNCRKTKCLKLYCDCFAAGFYCGESCACVGCFNRPEYEDTVLETRQQIESRNPLAFAPKVLQTVTASPTSSKVVSNLSTPSSARHKRGCNCKKSMCLKKYCECYQANVGCSEGCRCEGCKNIYGIREDYNIAREIMLKRASVEMSEGTMTVNNSFVSSRAHSSPNLTPITPALQCSDQKKNALKSRLPFRKFLHPPESHTDTLTSEENPASPSNSQNHGELLEKNKCTDVGVPDAEKGLENTEDRLVLAGDDESVNAHCSSQLSKPDVKNSILRNKSQPESFAESGPLAPSSSLRWRSSPITPITQLTTSELKEFGTGSTHFDMFEDDTPEILKQSPTPIKSVKLSSPNKKRISPPHNHINSSESLKISRKFVLRAVPSFPPLTPYSKNSNLDNRG
ncbi:protein tesmin/TSO1-like CXC 3 [Chenopodium quinoa]|uniref:protein tesmin/TSO1-like CXC 3 n=1 Tax=Chenopodium quinoa TaxID=63459 RepID=UPI000B77E65D|nr:protein tesmin/TSO1-like CXC 3 [Chenopodium quinoa]